jgi:hypothetical protein
MWTLISRAGLLAGVTGLVGAALTGSVAAQQKAGPPDFSSNEAGWIALQLDFFEIAGVRPGPIRADPAHPYFQNGTGVQPTFRISDLTNPNLKPWVKERMKKSNDEVLAGKIAYTPRSSCEPSGVPSFVSYSRFEPIYFLQTPKVVTIIFEGDHQVRHVYMDVPHSANLKPSWYGESVGHYEGDELVIDTIGQSTRTFVDLYRTPHTDKLHVVERWKMVEDGKFMEVTFRVEDPDAFNEPWTAKQRFRRVEQPMKEEVCAENNQNLFDYGIPIANKPDF